MELRTTGMAVDPRHEVLGSRLLPNVRRAAGRSRRLHVSAGGSHPRTGESERLPRCRKQLPAPARADVGNDARHRDRLAAGVRGRRRQLHLRPLAGGHAYLRRGRVCAVTREVLTRQNFATAPASTGSAAPVMYFASSEARNSTALLTARASISGAGSM